MGLVARHLLRKLRLDPRKVHVKFIANSGTGVVFSPLTSVFLISPVFLTHLHLSPHSALTRMTEVRNTFDTSKKSNALSEIGKHLK